MIFTEYTDKIGYMNFIESMIEEQQSMEDYVNKCIILSNPSKKVFKEFTVLNEAKAGDKIKGLFNRLKSFFSKIWQKFLEKLNAWVQDNKKYLNNYKDIIIGKQVTLIDVKMKNHFKGTKRIDAVMAKVNNFATPIDFEEPANKITKDVGTTINKDVDEQDKDYNTFLINQYNEVLKNAAISDITIKNNDDLNVISTTLTNYFNGGEESETFDNRDIQNNMKEMFNRVYSYNEYVSGLKKLREAYEAAMQKSEKAYETAFSKMSSLLKTAAQNNTPKNQKDISDYATELEKDLQDAKDRVERDEKEVEKEEFNMYSIYNNIIYEADGVSITTSSSDENNSSSGSSTIKGGGNAVKNTSGDKAKSVQQSLKAKTTDVEKNNSSNVQIKGAAASGGADAKSITDTEKLDQFQAYAMKLIRGYSTARTTVFGSIMNALTSMRNDYMTVIRAHVKTYLGKINDSGQDTSATTTT